MTFILKETWPLVIQGPPAPPEHVAVCDFYILLKTYCLDIIFFLVCHQFYILN